MQNLNPNKTFSGSQLEKIYSTLEKFDASAGIHQPQSRNPVHVVYGGAHLFRHDTPHKLGKLAVQSLETYAPNFAEFARAMWLKGAETLPQTDDAMQSFEFQFIENEAKAKAENYNAWLARTIYERTLEKLNREPIEDYRIDFEDGYGFRADAEEDSHAVAASAELAEAFLANTITAFCGFRIKSLQAETRKRAVRTLDLFLTNLLEKTCGKLPENFVVTLPKITRREEVEVLAELLSKFEQQKNLAEGAVKIEIMIETPESIVNEKGEIALRSLIEAGKGRVISAHFGAYDYTASFGISGVHQHLNHEACVFARQMMQISLAPLNIRLSDSVTTEMPVPIHKGENLTAKHLKENKRAVHTAWRKHFYNVTSSLINGFYQSWDLHPAQLAARYAAVYSFFLESQEIQAERLKGFVGKASQALTTGNTFDDAASANGLLNFFRRGLSSGAITETEITEKTGLSADDLKSASFMKIVENFRTEN
ncbi:MAG: aldolase/citrate lyase family protein [Acidobacteriota bacterium]|nr:aldolase/citrate lyase family protein [Acidobacteriota bacterium]